MHHLTFDFGVVAFRLAHQQSGSLAVQRICRVRIPQQLWEKDFEDVDHVVHWRPGLVDDIEANAAGPVSIRRQPAALSISRIQALQNLQFINVGMENAVHEAYARALVGILIGQFDVDFPEAALKGCCRPLESRA